MFPKLLKKISPFSSIVSRPFYCAEIHHWTIGNFSYGLPRAILFRLRLILYQRTATIGQINTLTLHKAPNLDQIVLIISCNILSKPLKDKNLYQSRYL